MIGQYIEYSDLAREGITINFADNEWQTFGMHFYVPTFFHGLHVLVGVLWCLGVARNAARGGYSATRYVGVEVFGLYWHFVDVVWIILFTLIYLL
jgi:heme/copper-type cytochrome/quinol oxidase subunit 3